MTHTTLTDTQPTEPAPINVMLDLETMGTAATSAIVAIGAVVFDLDNTMLGPRFYMPVSLASSVSVGSTMDPDTVLWWLRQSDDARGCFSGGGNDLGLALIDFADWIDKHGDRGTVRMWGNGAAFDNVILASAYRACRMPAPWKHWNDRCYRTIKAMHPHVKLQRVGTHHDALHDAESQALHMLAMLGNAQEPVAP